MAQSFSRFPELPAEIRLQIWRSALPAHDKASLFPWRLGCWELRPVPPSDPAHDPAAPWFPRLEFNHDLLHPLQCKAPALSPLLGVSNEARHVALEWIKDNGFELSLTGVYTRNFDPEIDVVFLPWLMPDDESPNTFLDTRSVFYNELFDRLQSSEALDAMRREAERRQLLRSEEVQLSTSLDGAQDIDGLDEGDYRKVDPWSAVKRFAFPARRRRSENEWTLLPHFFPNFDTLYILAPQYGATDEGVLQTIAEENMKMRRLYDLDPERNVSYMQFDGEEAFEWKGDWERDESLLAAGTGDDETLSCFRGEGFDRKRIVDPLLVLNIQDLVKDLGSAVRNTRDKRPFRFRPVPAWWTDS